MYAHIRHDELGQEWTHKFGQFCSAKPPFLGQSREAEASAMQEQPRAHHRAISPGGQWCATLTFAWDNWMVSRVQVIMAINAKKTQSELSKPEKEMVSWFRHNIVDSNFDQYSNVSRW